MTQVSPSRTIAIAGREYVLDGSFATLRAVQQFFREDIVKLTIGVTRMRLDEVADLIAIASGHPDKANEIGQAIIDTIGAHGIDYIRLKTELTAWLIIAISPPADRQKKKEAMDAILASQSSPGPTTSDLPSAPSNGNQPNSGAATSGS
jgi:hypothetical protein